MALDRCPQSDELTAFVRCSLPLEVADEIASHIEVCPQCEETVVGLEASTLGSLQRARNAPALFPFEEESECRRMFVAIVGRTVEPADEMPAAPVVPAELETLRDYRLLEKIGQGGMGAVYKALHTRLDRVVALKALPPELTEDQQAVARFAREMRAVGKLDHPNIVRAMDAGEHNGRHYLVMEFVEGADLSELLRKAAPLSVADCCEIIRQATVGLQYAHEHGLIHRDIKPGNIMLTNAGQVKILDFGLALLNEPADAGRRELTNTGQIMGTVDYMAPEQGGDTHSVDTRADLYSLGATLFKLLTGEAPFGEKYAKMIQKLTALATQPAPDVITRRSGVPPQLGAIVQRLLAKSPAARFATPEELVEAVTPFCAGADLASLAARVTGRPIPAAQPKPISASIAAPSDPHASVARPEPSASRSGFSRWRRVIACGALAAAILLGIVITIHTPKGTIEIELAQGVDSQSVAIAVKQGGREVDVADADHGWKLRITNGRYDLELKSGSDRFQLDRQSVIVSRNDKPVVRVTLKDTTFAAAAMSETTTPPDTSRQPAAKSITETERPFVLVRDGMSVSELRSLPAAIDESQAGDVIEIRSNARFRIEHLEPVKKPLHLRAGAGFRPMLAFVGAGKSFENGFIAEGIDIDNRTVHFYVNGPVEYRRCRIWGILVSGLRAPKFTASDCVLILIGGINPDFASTEVTFDNCLIRTHYLFGAESGSHKLQLQNCTFNGVIAELGEKAHLNVEATGNAFEIIGIDGRAWPRMEWHGRDNCFQGPVFWAPYFNDPVREFGLAGWNKLWNDPERDPRHIESFAFERGRIQRLDGAHRLKEIRAAVEKLTVTHNLMDFGPNWDLVGPGEAYLRALASEGRGVPDAQLRPERLDGGPFILIHEGKTVRGFLTLKEAIDAAQDKDAIEIRTDRAAPATVWTGGSRLLTIRAAAGYEPVIESIGCDSDQLVLEGLRINTDVRPSSGLARIEEGRYQFGTGGRGSILRLMNCTVSASVNGWMFSRDALVPEIVNCHVTDFQVGVPAGGIARVRNSVFIGGAINSESTTERTGTLELNRSVFWRTELELSKDGCLFSSTGATCIANQSVFVSPAHLYIGPILDGATLDFKGSTNVYMKPSNFQRGSGPYTLDDFRADRVTDADSVELPPWEFDPAQWRIDCDASRGYQPKPDGTDYGADIDRLISAIQADATSAK